MNFKKGTIVDKAGNVIGNAISQRTFHLLAMSLPDGPNFEVDEELSGWTSADGRSVALTYRLAENFGFLLLRQRIDGLWIFRNRTQGFASHELVIDAMCDHMARHKKFEPLPPGVKRRLPLFNKPGAGTFKILSESYTHAPAKWVVEELYRALPNPDDNFSSDMHQHCEARLWELYLFATFREQGLRVTQDQPSPDFRIEREDASAYVEAVTAHTGDGSSPGHAEPTFAPTDPKDRMAGEAAARFAKTLRSKLQRDYHRLPHVVGHPFALALADYHAPSSMVWSREALPTYLYGFYPVVEETWSGPVAVRQPISHLKGQTQIPAGIFFTPEFAHLSAIIFSNAGTLSKFNRMGFLAGLRPPGLSMERSGILFDRTEGAIKPIDFSSNILNSEYAALWPGGEKWCQELEVFHNPQAKHPFSHSLLPGATHWFEHEGEIVCEAFWENQFLASVTKLRVDNEALAKAHRNLKSQPLPD